MAIDAPMYKMDTKGVEAGYPGQTSEDTSGCTQALVIGGAALCCFLCMQLCKDKDNQNQSNAPNTANALGPLATGCLADLCRGNVSNSMNNSNRNYEGVDTQIITSPPDPSIRYGRFR